MELKTKKLLLYKFIQQECSPQETKEVCRWMKAADQDEALEAILADAWEEMQLFPAMEADLSTEIFEQVCRKAGINSRPAPVQQAQKLLAGRDSKWLFLAASVTLLLVFILVPRK